VCSSLIKWISVIYNNLFEKVIKTTRRKTVVVYTNYIYTYKYMKFLTSKEYTQKQVV